MSLQSRESHLLEQYQEEIEKLEAENTQLREQLDKLRTEFSYISKKLYDSQAKH